RRGVDPALCLACHQPLADRIERGSGLHARPGYERCERCHVDHHGREFELVWWGDDGRDAFRHADVGYELAGAHATLDCRGCHTSAHVADREALVAAGKDLDRTYLGLDTACASCHEDRHGGALGTSCTDCHTQVAWSPADGFRHADTAFPLRGAHATADCAGCHAGGGETGLDLGFAARGTTCAACHDDPHRGRLGVGCAGCHGETSWSSVEPSGFDHSRTRFPLRASHATTACDACHIDGRALAIAGFDRCTTCHQDPHLGQLSADGRRCTACHDEESFRPSSFTVADHQTTAYPLTGAHLAVACNLCHVPVAATELGLAAAEPGASTSVFTFAGTSCDVCHGSPHVGSTAEVAACDSCHDTDLWSTVAFDHADTGFLLGGAHADLACRSCHHGDGDATSLPFSELSTACAGCHTDEHRGQFAGDGGPPTCESCHDVAAWAPSSFDHATSRFLLEGAHGRAACEDCHGREQDVAGTFVRYRPLDVGCLACHGGAAEGRP
ncbi:MAG: cytochrome c3 family protein, partial [Thermoanaerobaculia bacterium]|nr:cytochrome c3 family protein [Thermoanaerobaculia bacterium]